MERVSEQEEKIVKKHVLSNWTRRKNADSFPGPQPVSIERKDLYKLTKFRYVVCEKTDGERYILVYMNRKGVFLVNRKFFVYRVNVEVSDHGSAIFDGELVEEKDGQLTYYIHDCVKIDDTNVSNENLLFRLNVAKNALTAKSILEPPVFKLALKIMRPISEFENLLKEQSDVTHDVDGLIFTPVDLAVQSGTQYSLFKWKCGDQHTIDFHISLKERRITMNLQESGKLVKYKILNTKTTIGRNFQKSMESLGEDRATFDKTILECKVENDVFKPVKIRDDKTQPNSVKTLEKTLLNIEENITLNELNILFSEQQ